MGDLGHTVVVGGREIALRLTFEAAMNIEAALGRGLVDVITTDLEQGKVSAYGPVFHSLALAGGTNLTKADAEALTLRHLKHVIPAVVQCLTEALADGEPAVSGEEEAPKKHSSTGGT